MEYIVTEYKHTGKGRIELCLNEKINLWLYSKEIKELAIELGSKLSEEIYQYILHDKIGKRAIKRAMHILERQERTEYQLREKLRQSEYPTEAVEDAIAYVKQYHYLDDERYARTYIYYHQENRSKRRLQIDLLRKGIAKEVISSSIEETFSGDERQQIRSLLEKKCFSPDRADMKETRKMYQFLLRRGFQNTDILAVMHQSDFAD